jgi:hypothetical protein
MLELQQLLDALGPGDVAPYSEVAAEPAVLVEQGLRAEREPELATAVGRGTGSRSP